MLSSSFQVPAYGQPVTFVNDQINSPDNPIIPFIEGDGIGPEIWQATRPVMDTAVDMAYQGKRRIAWMEVFAGQKAKDQLNTWLPEETLQAFSQYKVGLKGPLSTPVGGGIRSINVSLRQKLDLYVCLRPVRWFKGAPSPVIHPEKVNMAIFRENTEDLYLGIEFPMESEANQQLKEYLRLHFPSEYAELRFPETTALGIKPISKQGSERLVRAAIRWALENKKNSVTLVHKGNIMKYTEGAFRNWGFALAEAEFGKQVYTMMQWERCKKAHGEDAANAELESAKQAGKLLIKDLIADITFEQTLTRPEDFDVIATMNLNGDYLSDGLSAQVGGVGIAPGANINFETGVAIFEAIHGTAPKFTGMNVVNPSSMILSGEMLLRYLGWDLAADLIIKGIEGSIAAKTVTFDLHHLMPGSTLLNTTEFAQAIIQNMQQ